MIFVHEDPEFRDLLRIVADEVGINPALVEKDYWVTHTLWALLDSGLEVWFKGGTSLSKGFGIIERFSEDLDLYVEPGEASQLPAIASWKSMNKGPIARRHRFFEKLETVIRVPQASLYMDRTLLDKRARTANYRVEYPGLFLSDLGSAFRPFVLLEIGAARVTPCIPKNLRSFVHDWLAETRQLSGYIENLPLGVRCVHPIVSLLEKLDAISRRYPRRPVDPASFIRHYEDAARIIETANDLPPLGMRIDELVDEMLGEKHLAHPPDARDAAFTLTDEESRRFLLQAHRSIAPMFWGRRHSLDEACRIIRSWLSSTAKMAAE